ncbi:Semaphorin-1A [Melipona quadrifasciata]|uniref:Semaphorin-1A n=1 Tax=Melipona quadrifasciata TaxID=166423 RepID=A0A0M9A0S9_9HYME|nr:Semaphorin-1A [Melipona quadrifasciata]
MDGLGLCPYDPRHNSTAVFVEGQLYAATVADFSGGEPLIHREKIRTERSDLNQLNGPNFVSSFAYEDYVFFFYRETAVEYMNCGKFGQCNLYAKNLGMAFVGTKVWQCNLQIEIKFWLKARANVKIAIYLICYVYILCYVDQYCNINVLHSLIIFVYIRKTIRQTISDKRTDTLLKMYDKILTNVKIFVNVIEETEIYLNRASSTCVSLRKRELADPRRSGVTKFMMEQEAQDPVSKAKWLMLDGYWSRMEYPSGEKVVFQYRCKNVKKHTEQRH